jgi:hypothetical protein
MVMSVPDLKDINDLLWQQRHGCYVSGAVATLTVTGRVLPGFTNCDSVICRSGTDNESSYPEQNGVLEESIRVFTVASSC